jgi:hypothetical protein
MFQRLAEERLKVTPPTIWRTKLRRGGLMEADYLKACFEVLGQTPPSELTTAIDNWNETIIWERLLNLTGADISETPSRFTQAISTAARPKLWAAQDSSLQALTDAFFEDQKTGKRPPSRSVIWRDS